MQEFDKILKIIRSQYDLIGHSHSSFFLRYFDCIMYDLLDFSPVSITKKCKLHKIETFYGENGTTHG